jgi:hypothetical protein
MRLPGKQFRHFTTGLMFLLLIPLLWGFSASPVNAGETSSSLVFQKLDNIDPDALSPEEAKSLLRELKSLAQKEESVLCAALRKRPLSQKRA